MHEYCFAYYCSGHGYGHATRVSAFASHLLSLQPQPTIYIVSSAPRHVFADSIALGALYRYAEIDPVIVQPLAYRVDRQKSVDVLHTFLNKKEKKIEEEARWLQKIHADCVLSDAAFLAFLAAHEAQLPSILITNFTFDAVYSYLSASFVDQSRPHRLHPELISSCPNIVMAPDTPISEEQLHPLVSQIYEGYRHADLLLCLPGAIPIPSFAYKPALPATDWIDRVSEMFKPAVISDLIRTSTTQILATLMPSSSIPRHPVTRKARDRTALSAPLLVRFPSPDAYTSAGRSRILASIGVPDHLHDPTMNRILVVSFGGQIIHRPSHSRSHSRSQSRSPSRSNTGTGTPSRPKPDAHTLSGDNFTAQLTRSLNTLDHLDKTQPSTLRLLPVSPPLSTPSHIYIPGAPAPASKLTSSPIVPSSIGLPVFNTIPPTPIVLPDEFMSPSADMSGTESQLVPDDSWLVIVCGVSDSKDWRAHSRPTGVNGVIQPETVNGDPGNYDDELPEGFYIAPKDVYMPDLMAVGDVLLGKLGYGTVSECIESCTPFVYVSRPLFVEEHGLRLYLSREGVGIEMEHEEYEAGNWAGKVAEAWQQGARRKHERRMGENVQDRRQQGKEMAQFVVDWVSRWAE
ncbi:hypothetical protein EW146_g7042 [Bondarzewia mesenterica]|uniref:Glycosyl transferase family 28 C-terminal domain-containing protein n=1 Tax=Bondarzewia mesenterica TaxID=1095465 RepID=A0A4S4LMJ0_9AGAM|nr:hypothetical protein EW146_g7042 [Bondarzewia mesenterica]